MGLGCQQVYHWGFLLQVTESNSASKTLYWKEGILGDIIQEAGECKMEEQNRQMQTQPPLVLVACCKGPTLLWPQAVTAAFAITTGNASGLLVLTHPSFRLQGLETEV